MPELLVVLVIVLIVFGAGKISEIGGALGRGINEFRKNSQSDEKKDAPAADVDTAGPKVIS